MIHEAGDLTNEGVQRCTRCMLILTDYRNAMVPDGSPPLHGWAVGAFVNVNPGEGYTAMVATDEQPTCSPLWGLVRDVERAAWTRSWPQLKQARKALEPYLGKRPHFPNL